MSTHRITYRFGLPSGARFELPLALTDEGACLELGDRDTWPAWTALERNRCAHCPLDPAVIPRCPLAAAIVDVVEAADELVSHEQLEVRVIHPAREVRATLPAADALRSLMGLLIPTSGCPHTAFFKPMARFHLPFSDQGETLYRVTSMYQLAQHVRRSRGLDADEGFGGLAEIYANLNVVNMHLVERLQEAAGQDSSRNAVSLLDVFAQLLPLQLDDALDELLPCFDAYLE
jgi:hypothetical protein